MRVLHQEDREGLADFIALLEFAGDGWAMELDGDLRRPDVVDDELEDAGVPGTKKGKGELQER
jgi:hypothetical protein